MDPTSHRPAFEAAGEPGDDLQIMRELARHCTRCDLYRHATHLVFGEGPPDVDVVLVGEQSGDKKDLAARPFVGPAALLLDRCLENAGIDRARCYVTNAVKHFKWEARGKRRIHKRPSTTEVTACSVWLEREVAAVRPHVVVALGATAVRAVLGRSLPVGRTRGQVLESTLGVPAVTTVHPASVVRLRDAAERSAALAGLVADLRVAAATARGNGDGVDRAPGP